MSHRERQLRRRRRRNRLSGPLLALVVLGTVVGIVGLSVLGYVVAVASSTPNIGELKPEDAGATSSIFAADGSRLGFVRSDEVRTPIKYGQMPAQIREATVAIEDEEFFEHNGVDYGAIVRAGVKNVSSGQTVQGGSTITQQLARALYIPEPERTIDRKIREAKLATEIEDEHSKDWILRQYLNSVPYGTVNGRTALGVQAASEVYFSKDAEELNLHEAALLAGLPQAPSEYNPFRNANAALERRDEVLAAMLKNGFITREEAEKAAAKPLGLKESDIYTEKREPYFFDYVQEKLIERYGVGTVRQGGLEVHTTIDPELQDAGRTAIASSLNLPTDPSSALVAIDPSNGDIKAMASSGGYDDRTFNLAAQGHRQPGSAFKPMVLTTAIRKGVDPETTYYESKPLSLNLPEYGPWQVKTYDDTYGGRMNLVEGTLKSDNTVYAQLIADMGPDEVEKTAKLMGITSKLDGLPAEGLGGLRVGVSPLEMANAYATLASGGIRTVPEAIERVKFPNGDVEDFGKPERKRVFSDGVAYEVTKILRQNVQSGTGTKASIGCTQGTAGKTGTTDRFNDAWFVGYTPSLATSVWIGYPDAQQEMTSVHGISVAGGTFPAEIWSSFMSVANGTCESFPTPSEPASLTAYSGKFATSGKRSTASSPSKSSGDVVGGGSDGYDSDYYAEPPQPTPSAPSAPAAPAPAPPGGGGGGGGGGATDDSGAGAGGGASEGAEPPSGDE